jgi:hypothetical protein
MEHSHVHVRDEKSDSERQADARFHNCELRRYRIEMDGYNDERPIIVLTELDLHSDTEEEEGEQLLAEGESS